MKNILVTGCAGFIGSNFCRQFADQFSNVKVIGLDDLSSGRREVIDKRVKFYKGSIINEKLVENIFKTEKPEYVFHFAAIPRVSFSVEEPVKTTDANVLGTVVILNAARKYSVKRVVLSSSSSVYGGAKKLPTKEIENLPDPKSPYAGQKYCDEVFCKIFGDIYKLDTVCLRYFNVYGPGQYGDSAYSTVISAWLEALYFPKNKKAFIEGDGNQSRDFCYVDNVVQANIKAMQMKKNSFGEVFNIAHGERTSVNTVKKLIEKHTERRLELEKRASRIGDVKHTHADISKAKKWFGYNPTVTFEEGLVETVKWFKNRKK